MQCGDKQPGNRYGPIPYLRHSFVPLKAVSPNNFSINRVELLVAQDVHYAHRLRSGIHLSAHPRCSLTSVGIHGMHTPSDTHHGQRWSIREGDALHGRFDPTSDEFLPHLRPRHRATSDSVLSRPVENGMPSVLVFDPSESPSQAGGRTGLRVRGRFVG